ncbi:hypothetical protein AsGV144 [Agrotis segetum granulovirus]|uniref:Uncharacterized protein n=1 Tax=Agrotis segetum granulosis virus TaxID=10464 RepID=A0A023MI89_GVAS|nr:hypothetical protein AsGV144 [Agrotis segetum granulovirus]AHN92180.1 hypothetical protein AsGV141 [Agrotis segetum granulovirus]AKN63418.1 hypothetical protein AsGV144 [Agrotis segetum granulovirus]
MENLTRFNQTNMGFFSRFSWKMVILVLVAVLAIIAVSYNFSDEFIKDTSNPLSGKVQRVKE